VSRVDPLRGLHEVDWAGLTHAYGPAGDVPGQLAGLRSSDPGRRDRALHHLYGSIFHQGSRFEATAYAIPFLLALAADPDTAQRDELVMLLAALAVGFDNEHLPGGVDIRAWRSGAARLSRADPARSDTELAAYDAVRAGVPALLGLLADPSPRARSAAVYALSWFPEESPRILPRLLNLLRAEPVPDVAANALIAAGLLGDRALVGRIRGFLHDSQRVLRWAAAVALTRLGDGGPQVTGELAACLVNPPAVGKPGIRFFEGDLRGYAAISLASLGDDAPAQAVTAVLDGLAACSGWDAIAVTEAALRLTFGARPVRPLPGFDELSQGQQRVVRTLAALGGPWQLVNFTDILRAWNLPADRAECRSYALLSP
jgi:hypothetical protein